MIQKQILFFIFISLLIIKSYGQDDMLKYLGQKPMDSNPVVFAKDIISTKKHEHSAPAISTDGKEIYWSCFDTSSTPVQTIYFIKFENNKWSTPRMAAFSGLYSDGGPCFINNGNRLFFYSHRPLIGNTAEIKDDIWYVDRIGSEWTTPKNLGLSYLSNREKWIFSPSISDSGNIYITGAMNNVNGLYKIHIDKGMFQKPVPLDEIVNSNYDNFNWTPFISPDESYLIFSSKRDDSKGFNDLYICFKQKNGKWGTPMNMGDKINNGNQVRFPYVSRDGKYLFFTRHNGNNRDDIFWVDAKIIDELKNKR